MKIAVNLTRERLGGITASTINLMGYLTNLDYKFVGVELNSREYMRGSTIFRPFPPEVFDHHIINTHHLSVYKIVNRSKTLKEIERAYRGSIRILRQVLRQTKPDVVLLSGTYYIPWLISIAAYAEKIPIVLRYAGIYSLETKYMTPSRRKLYASMEQSIVRRASHIIFPSRLCRDMVLTEVVGRPIKNSYIIPNSVAPIFTDPGAYEQSLERRIALVARYDRVKNFPAFFALHRELLKRKWEHTASLITKAGTKIKYIPKTVDMLPPMTREGLKKFYLTQGLVISPSTFETFGNVPMEAACLGIPVLVSETMGCAEILKKVGLGNMITSFEDISNVADQAQALCGQYILPKQMNALKKILDHRFIGEEIAAVLHDAVSS